MLHVQPYETAYLLYRLSSPADQHQSPAQIKQAEPAEAGSHAIVSAAKDGKPVVGELR